MSGIVLSSSVRQNLLSLQSTADLLATTQSRLSTGKSVNSALDNPTNFFTAQSLDNRASDINNLLDGIANGVQVLQAANTGITSLQKLIDSAKSIANQALQTTVGYSTKSNVSTTIAGATAADLRGTTSFASATASSNVVYNGTAGGTTAATGSTTLGATIGSFASTGATAGDGTTALTGTITLIATNGTTATGLSGNAQPADGDTLTVNGKTITFRSGSAPASTAVASGSGVSGNLVTDGSGNTTVYLGTAGTPAANVNDLLTAIDLASGVKTVSITAGAATFATSVGQTASTAAGGAVTLKSSTGADLSVTGKADLLKALALTTAVGGGNATVSVNRTTSAASLGATIADGSTLNVDGHVITFKNAPIPGSTGAPSVPSGYGASGNVRAALAEAANFFTAQSLDNRASDINNLLDGIANGVQVLQAANTGITSLQKLIDSAKSIANQALQTTVGYSTKSNVSTTIAGATAADLRGTTSFAKPPRSAPRWAQTQARMSGLPRPRPTARLHSPVLPRWSAPRHPPPSARRPRTATPSRSTARPLPSAPVLPRRRSRPAGASTPAGTSPLMVTAIRSSTREPVCLVRMHDRCGDRHLSVRGLRLLQALDRHRRRDLGRHRELARSRRAVGVPRRHHLAIRTGARGGGRCGVSVSG
ncbi:Flagellar hookassociated protein FliD [Bradyrhizobium sp.]|nr:Flagellar hookassociated protein FliD [Bradyrhizobium sp.]